MDSLRLVKRRPGRLPPPRRLARIVAPAVFLLAMTGVVLLVRSSLRSTEPEARGASAPARIAARVPVTPPSTSARRFYVISSGDTLGAIAERFSTSVGDLLRLNPGVQPTGLRPGEQIRIR